MRWRWSSASTTAPSKRTRPPRNPLAKTDVALGISAPSRASSTLAASPEAAPPFPRGAPTTVPDVCLPGRQPFEPPESNPRHRRSCPGDRPPDAASPRCKPIAVPQRNRSRPSAVHPRHLRVQGDDVVCRSCGRPATALPRTQSSRFPCAGKRRRRTEESFGGFGQESQILEPLVEKPRTPPAPNWTACSSRVCSAFASKTRARLLHGPLADTADSGGRVQPEPDQGREAQEEKTKRGACERERSAFAADSRMRGSSRGMRTSMSGTRMGKS